MERGMGLGNREILPGTERITSVPVLRINARLSPPSAAPTPCFHPFFLALEYFRPVPFLRSSLSAPWTNEPYATQLRRRFHENLFASSRPRSPPPSGVVASVLRVFRQGP